MLYIIVFVKFAPSSEYWKDGTNVAHGDRREISQELEREESLGRK